MVQKNRKGVNKISGKIKEVIGKEKRENGKEREVSWKEIQRFFQWEALKKPSWQRYRKRKGY